MHKAMLKLILVLFILEIINPGIGSAVVPNAGSNDYYQACVKQSQVLPLVKNVPVKIAIR